MYFRFVSENPCTFENSARKSWLNCRKIPLPHTLRLTHHNIRAHAPIEFEHCAIHFYRRFYLAAFETKLPYSLVMIPLATTRSVS
jgi:hypothetical protein